MEKKIADRIKKLALDLNPKATQEYFQFLVSRCDRIFRGHDIDLKKFDAFIERKISIFSKARKPASLFLSILENEPLESLVITKEISANPQDLDDKAAQLEDLESFEKEVDAWIRMFEDVDDKLYVGAPLSRGIDKYNNVRGVFDGLGSFVYTDGTVSKKYPKLEDLSKEDRDALIVRIDVHHRGLPGHDDIVALVKGV